MVYLWSMTTRFLNIRELLDKSQSFFLFGPRGTGKSSLLAESTKGMAHVMRIDLLAVDIYRRYLENPSHIRSEIESLISKRKGPAEAPLVIILDEVQKVPALLDEVHKLIETYKKRVVFALTGSSARKLKRGGANLLAGRAWLRYLHPFSFVELDIDLNRSLQFGSLPGIYLSDSPEEMLRSYVDTYLKEEVLQEALIRRVENFSRFLDLAGQLNGEPINFSKAARQCGVSVKTLQEYFQILEDTLLVRRISGWSSSVKKQLMQAPKFYFFDCGVLNAINGELRTEVKPSTFRYGRLFECNVVQEIVRANDYAETNYRISYWRTSKGEEVDIVLSNNATRPLWGVEIKSNAKPNADDLTSLTSFLAENTAAKGVCLCTTPRAYRVGSIDVVPWREGIRDIFYK